MSDMALDVSFENDLWNVLSNANVGDEMVGQGNEEENVGHDEESLGLNTKTNESQMEKQLDVGLIGGVDDAKVGGSKNDGKKSKRKRKAKGKAIDLGNDQGDLNELKEKKTQRKSNRKWRNLAIRVVVEKERRNKEAKLFDELRELIPDLPPKAYKATIVIEAIKLIKKLEETLHRLKMQKQERLLQYAAAAAAASTNSDMAPIVQSSHATPPINNNKGPSSFKTWTSPNVTLSVCGADAVINICTLKKPGLNTAISFILMKHNLEAQSFHISTVGAKTMLMIRLHGNVAPEFAEGFLWEEKYKKVAAEIMVCVNA